jgi:hypothetical protein
MPATWNNQNKSGTPLAEVYLLIDNTFFFLIDSTHKLIIQDAQAGTVWANQNKS